MMTMEEADRTRLARSSLFALAFWLLVAASLALVPLARSKPAVPTYSTVRLTLNEQAPTVQTAPSVADESVPAPTAPAPAPAPAQTNAAPALSRSAKAASKASAAKAAAATSAKIAPKSATAGGLGIPNFSTPVSGSTRSESSGESLDFQSAERLPRTDSAATANASSVSEFEGVAAPIASSVPSTAKGAGTQTAGAAPAKASGETVSALGELTGAAQRGTKGASASASTPAETHGSAGGTSGSATASKATGTTAATATSSSSSVSSLAFEGTPRRLLQPAKIEITLPEELARLVTSNRAVVVSLTIRADGTVPSGLVEFTPSALLPARVRDWLAREFSAWRFEKGAQDGQARFSYSITVE